MHIILFFLLFVVAIVVFGISILGFILKSLFGIGRSSSSRTQQTNRSQRSDRQYQGSYSQSTNNYSSNEEDIYTDNSTSNKHRKIFSQEDGEYVDFEEVK